MLEKSLGLMFFQKKPKNYESGAMYVYLKVTVDGIPKDLSVKRSWLTTAELLRETITGNGNQKMRLESFAQHNSDMEAPIGYLFQVVYLN